MKLFDINNTEINMDGVKFVKNYKIKSNTTDCCSIAIKVKFFDGTSTVLCYNSIERQKEDFERMNDCILDRY